MARTPEERRITELFDVLRTYQKGRKPKPGDDGMPSIDQLEVQLLDAVRRDLVGSVVPDGYPTATLDGGRGGAELTPTESAAHQRTGNLFGERMGARHMDPHHKLTKDALTHLGLALNELGAFCTALRNIQKLTDQAPVIPSCCAVCERAGIVRAPKHYSSVGGRLATEIHLCEAHYRFVWDHQRQPTVEETQHHDQTGRWRIRQVATVGS